MTHRSFSSLLSSLVIIVAVKVFSVPNIVVECVILIPSGEAVGVVVRLSFAMGDVVLADDLSGREWGHRIDRECW